MFFNNQTTGNDTFQQSFAGRGCGGFKGGKMGKGLPPWAQRFASAFTGNVPVNIEENDNAYLLRLYAAGLVKENFALSVNNDVLKVTYTSPKKPEVNYAYSEYALTDFERMFQLNNNVLTQNISANYADGVLIVTLPKNPDTVKPAQNINVN